MFVELDLRGQACPQPVIATKRQLDALPTAGGNCLPHSGRTGLTSIN